MEEYVLDPKKVEILKKAWLECPKGRDVLYPYVREHYPELHI